MGTNRTSLAVVDSRITNQATSLSSLGFDSVVDGSAHSINVGPATSTSSIVGLINAGLREISDPVKLDIICHGAAGLIDGASSRVYRLQLGEPGIYNHSFSLTPWRELSGRVTKVRFMSCGVRSETISSNFTDSDAFDSQNVLMLAFARTSNRTVKYTYETYFYDVAFEWDRNSISARPKRVRDRSEWHPANIEIAVIYSRKMTRKAGRPGWNTHLFSTRGLCVS